MNQKRIVIYQNPTKETALRARLNLVEPRPSLGVLVESGSVFGLLKIIIPIEEFEEMVTVFSSAIPPTPVLVGGKGLPPTERV